MTIKITCSAFSHQRSMPQQYTADGTDVSPPLARQGVPERAKELAIIRDDPDAPSPQTWVHGLIYKVQAEIVGADAR